MKKEHKKVLLELADMFEAKPRLGASRDMPEGVRYIQFSSTLAGQLAIKLRRLVRAYD